MHDVSDFYRRCLLCPRSCGIDRTRGIDRSRGELGICRESADVRAAWAGLHFGEEPCLVGSGGSGTVFFSGCTLRCTFCQNFQISQEGAGALLDTPLLVQIFRELSAAGAVNLNFVTGTQFIPGIAEAVGAARAAGCSLPVLWNTSGYESATGMDILDSFVDVYLPDIKSLSPEQSLRYYTAINYPQAVRESVLRMVDSRPLEYRDGLLVRGVVVRHLILPNAIDETRRVLEWYAENIGDRALLSIMAQYTPVFRAGRDMPGREVDEAEYDAVLSLLEEFGLEEGFMQDLVPGLDWLPDFSREQPFSSGLARSIWHYNEGFIRDR